MYRLITKEALHINFDVKVLRKWQTPGEEELTCNWANQKWLDERRNPKFGH